MKRAIDREVQPARLMRGRRITSVFPFTGPMFEYLVHERRHIPVRIQSRSKIECCAELAHLSSASERSGQSKVATQRFQDVLPGSGRSFVSHRDGRTTH